MRRHKMMWDVRVFNVKVQLTDFWSMLLMLSDPDRIQSQNRIQKQVFVIIKSWEKSQMKEKFEIFLIKSCSDLQEGLLGSEEPTERTYSSS